MPSLVFEITGVVPAPRSLSPLLHFALRITNLPPDETIQAVLLSTQIHIQPAQRAYTPAEQEKLVELFGPPEMWGQTLRNRLWTHTNATVGTFQGSTEPLLPAPCTADLSDTAAKYFYALEDGDVPLLFLFSGSVFYTNAGRLQVGPISWNQECVFRMPVRVWQSLMEHHNPNSSWVPLRRDTYERLYAHRRRHSLMTWEETIDHLLQTRSPSLESVLPEPKREHVAA
ncbi:MAG TPA: DUF6084 family protein [Candidatus Acidoferrum sp.]|nr:DUF6084 family protein [Candidatus Acidoferrum sp.]